MSMLSSQVDELRELATRYYELQVGAVKAVIMPSNMGSILRDAADTIWQLCDDLQRAHRENVKLREYVTKLEKANIVLDSDNTDLLCDMKDMQFFIAENAKLRDENSRLQKYAFKALSAISYCDCCPYVDCGCDTETVPMHEGCKAFEELRELGVEVEQ